MKRKVVLALVSFAAKTSLAAVGLVVTFWLLKVGGLNVSDGEMFIIGFLVLNGIFNA